jgi:sulfopyruvate decarboxylase subunit beta
VKVGEAFRWLADVHGEQIVVLGLGTSTQEWHRIFGPAGDDAFHMHTMGLAAAFGLGLAVAQPEKEVWVVDGDGSLTLSFGSLLTMAEQQPPNLHYVLTSNRVYGTIDGPRLPNAEATDYVAAARAVGIERATSAGSVQELAAAHPLLTTPGFSFLVMEVEQGRVDGPRPLADYEGPEIKYRFARQLESRHGIRVLGRLGY